MEYDILNKKKLIFLFWLIYLLGVPSSKAKYCIASDSENSTVKENWNEIVTL